MAKRRRRKYKRKKRFMAWRIRHKTTGLFHRGGNVFTTGIRGRGQSYARFADAKKVYDILVSDVTQNVAETLEIVAFEEREVRVVNLNEE